VVVLEQRVSLRAGGVHEQLAERVAPAAEPLELRDAEPALRRLLGPAAARLLRLLLLLPGRGRVPPHHSRPRHRHSA